MRIFRRRERVYSGPSYAEEESNPELLAAERAVNQMPDVPMVGGVRGVILGQQPQIVGISRELSSPLESTDDGLYVADDDQVDGDEDGDTLER